jgi:hypothetical protein
MNTLFANQLANDDVYPHHLDQEYPHIVTRMSEHWGDGSFSAFVDGLLFDERGGRTGFSPDILDEIFVVQNHYRSLQPARPVSIDTWADSVALPKRHSHAWSI